MFVSYLKSAWRNLRKNAFFSGLNIFGLAVGMATCMLIMMFVHYEKSFDNFHTKNIYRLDEVQQFPGMVAAQKVSLSMPPMGPAIQRDFPQVKSFTRLRSYRNMDLTSGDKKLVFPNVLFADSNLLNFFDFPLLEGLPGEVLQRPNSLVLTHSAAVKMLGTDDVVGKMVSHYGTDTIQFTITGILNDIPANSHLQFDAIFPIRTVRSPESLSRWGGNSLRTYFELTAGADPADLEKKFPALLRKYMDEEPSKFYTLYLQPLAAIHGGSADITHDDHNYQKFDERYTSVFLLIAGIVLVIACINFMNLATAKSATRAREVGVRKSIGALRGQLAVQFISESLLICFLALLLACAIVVLALPYFRQLSERDLHFPIFTNPYFLLILVSGTVITGVIAGIYPAIYLSSFQPVKVLKGAMSGGPSKSRLRNLLVVSQFAGSVFLIVATVIAVKQLRFMQQKDPGFNREQVVLIQLNNKTYERYKSIKESLLAHSGISTVSASWQRLGNNLHQTGVRFHGSNGVKDLATSRNVVDPDYLKLYKIPLIAGRDFSRDYQTDNGKAYIINQSLANELLKEEKGAGPESLIGKRFGFNGSDSAGTIIGVTKDFNFNSLHHKVETLCMLSQTDWGYSEISVKLSGTNNRSAIQHLEKVWKDIVPDFPLEYSFLEEHFSSLYKADRQVSEVVGILAALAIVISCLGLFGLASFSAEKRFKEIGIRKVLGASSKSVAVLLSKDFIGLVILANLIAWPLAWWATGTWLEGFAFRISASPMVYVLAGLGSLLIAVVTVCFQALKASIVNPVKSLKAE